MLDIKKPFGECLGGVLDGCVIQDDRFYERDGTEVDVNRKPVKQAAKKAAAPQGKEAAKEPAIDPQVAEQLKD